MEPNHSIIPQPRCFFCGRYFRPDNRVGRRQVSCGRAECQQERRQRQQQRWREANPEYFRGRYEEVKAWRQSHPGYQKHWRAKKAGEIQTQMDERLCVWQTWGMKRQAKSYSIVDHQLLHGGYLNTLTHKALVVYLFLVVVGDATGRSFYSVSSMGRILRMADDELAESRTELVEHGLIDYRPPYWRVLTLTYPGRSKEAGAVGVLVNQTLKMMGSLNDD